MKSIASSKPGGSDTLELVEAPEPVAVPGQILVEVGTCGLDYPDLLLIQDLYQQKMPRPFMPGGEIAGTVLALGEEVRGIRIGGRIVGTTSTGGLCERAVVMARNAIAIPDGMSFAEGSAFIVCHGTALYALDTLGKLKAGETLLVTGAAGGAGRAAVEPGVALGSTVVAAEEKAAVARAAGAHNVVIYPPAPLDRDSFKAAAELFEQTCEPQGADVIFDVVGGDYSEPALRAVAWVGRFLTVGFAAGIARIPSNLALFKAVSSSVYFGGIGGGLKPVADRVPLEHVVQMYCGGTIPPLISRQVTLERAADGFRAFSKRSAVEKSSSTWTRIDKAEPRFGDPPRNRKNLWEKFA